MYFQSVRFLYNYSVTDYKFTTTIGIKFATIPEGYAAFTREYKRRIR